MLLSPVSAPAVAPLDAVIATDRLFRRPVRKRPDHEAEARALGALADEVGSPPDEMLQQVVRSALRACRAHSAGLSVLDEKQAQPVFRWRAVAGEWARQVGGATPRDLSPCGVVLDRASPQLFVALDRYYPQFRGMTRPAREALLVPFVVAGEGVGALWVVSHDDARQFDAEDLRLLSKITRFASGTFGLVAAAAKRKQAERNRDDFLATMVHELRGPLEPLRSSLRVMHAASDDARVVAQARAVMDRQLTLLTRLVDDLLDVDRIRLGKIRLNIGPTEIGTVIATAVETCRPGMERRGHDLVIDLPPDPIVVNADGARLSQVLSNLLNNAAKYTQDNGRIRLTVARRGAKVEIAVRDNGLGISRQMLPLIFNLFTQSSHSLRLSQGGLGIGLHIARRLVELHGGSIAATSDGVGRGSEFVVTLPAGPALV